VNFLELYMFTVFDLLCEQWDGKNKKCGKLKEKKEVFEDTCNKFNEFKRKECVVFQPEKVGVNPFAALAGKQDEEGQQYIDELYNVEKGIGKNMIEVKNRTEVLFPNGMNFVSEGMDKAKPPTPAELFLEGLKRRVTKPTLFNPQSSRGHAVMTLKKETCRLVVGDLAGYEDPSQVKGDIKLTDKQTPGHQVVQEGRALVAGIDAVGWALEELANKEDKEEVYNSKNVLLQMLHLTGQKFMNAMFIVCINLCGPGKGRLADTFKALDTGTLALNAKFNVKPVNCEDNCGVCGEIDLDAKLNTGKCTCTADPECETST